MPPKAAMKADRKAAKLANTEKPKGKRSASAFIIFSTEKRPEIKISHPTATFAETGRIVGQMWAALDEKAKAVSSIVQFKICFASLCFYCNVFLIFLFRRFVALCQGSACQKGGSWQVITPNCIPIVS
jgi:hypothetical protein